MLFDEENDPLAEEALVALNNGCHMIKHWSTSGQGRRHLTITKDFLVLRITKDTCFGPKTSKINLKHVEEVRLRHRSPLWQRMGHRAPDKFCCFSLVVEGRVDAIHFEAPSRTLCDLWTKGLKHLSEKIENMKIQHKRHYWVKQYFKLADKDSSGHLSKREILKLFKKINMELDEDYFTKMFAKYDVSADGYLSEEEFVNFFRDISWRSEIERIFKSYCDCDFRIEAGELVRFFKEEMQEDLTGEDAMKLINDNEPDHDMKKNYHMSYYGFLYLLLSHRGNVFDHKRSQVYHDMAHPLQHYFIASSHNTYLVGHQLYGESSVESYIRALERGCRCIELDTWDGEDGEPIIYHGYTLVSKIKFKLALLAINHYAFKKSQYPLILSVENHCSVSQQTKMAEYLKAIFGTKLLLQPVDERETTLPSPEMLKGKIIVKGKKLPSVNPGEDDSGEVTDEDEAADMDDEEVKRKAKVSKKKKIKLSDKLSECVVYTQSRRFRGLLDASSTFVNISSLNEDKAGELCTDQAGHFSERNQSQLIRIYPRGGRTNSSNYNPLPFWNVGCQIVAINYQTLDKPNHFYTANFRDNGQCGYLLKPEYLQNGSFDPQKLETDMKTFDLTIRIISGQQLPKPKKGQRGDIVDPFIEIAVRGCSQDRISYRTKKIKDNGFNPTWEDESFNLSISAPELAFITFKAYDEDGGSKKQLLGIYTLRATCLAKGYRHVHLEDMSGNSLAPATLFIQVL